jgi:hypothetical protein
MWLRQAGEEPRSVTVRMKSPMEIYAHLGLSNPVPTKLLAGVGGLDDSKEG